MNPSGTVTEPQEIFLALLNSRNTGVIIGIRSSPLGNITYLTGVEDIRVDNAGNITVVLKPCDTSGYAFPIREIDLDKICSVIPFSTRFQSLLVEKKSGVVEKINQMIF
jgi:hypothetical protein